MGLAWRDSKVTPFLTRRPYIGANIPVRSLWEIKMRAHIKRTLALALIIIIFSPTTSRRKPRRVLLRVKDLTKTLLMSRLITCSDPPVIHPRCPLFQKATAKGTNCGMRSNQVRTEWKHHKQAPVWIQKWFESVNQLVLRPLWLRYQTMRIRKWMTLRRSSVRTD